VAIVWLSWAANQGRGTICPFSLFTRDLGGAEVALVAAFSFSKRRASRTASCSGVGVNFPGITVKDGTAAEKNEIRNAVLDPRLSLGAVMLCLKTQSQAHRLSLTYTQWHESLIVLL
jgi:hypothetical protein